MTIVFPRTARTFLRGASLMMRGAGLLAGAALGAEEDPKPAWAEDVSKAEIPDRPAEGMISGEKFVVEKATCGSGILTLRQGDDFFPDRAFMIFTFVHDDEELPGKIFTVAHSEKFVGGAPHIHLKFKEGDANLPESEVFMKGYSMRLELGEATPEGIPGRIYLCVPGGKKSFVAGSFLVVKD